MAKSPGKAISEFLGEFIVRIYPGGGRAREFRRIPGMIYRRKLFLMTTKTTTTRALKENESTGACARRCTLWTTRRENNGPSLIIFYSGPLIALETRGNTVFRPFQRRGPIFHQRVATGDPTALYLAHQRERQRQKEREKPNDVASPKLHLVIADNSLLTLFQAPPRPPVLLYT